MKRRQLILTAALTCLLLLTAVWCYGNMTEARVAAVNATDGLAECKHMADQIRRFNDRPAVASDQVQLDTETTGMIQKAARAAGISDDSLKSIDATLAPRRVDDSSYKEKPTHVRLKSVTLKQLVALVHGLATGPNSLRAKSIRMAAPRADDTSSLWSADIDFTYLIYSPPTLPK